MKNTAIVAGLHGDEKISLEIIDKLSSNIPVYMGNPEATEKSIRFIDKDMNRVFPGKIDGVYEERKAIELLEKINNYKYIIDIHTSSCELELFGIITKPNKEKLEFAKNLGLEKLVIMPKKIAKGNSLIDNVECGISLEIGPHGNKNNFYEIEKIIKNFPNKNKNIELYEVFDIITGQNTKTYMTNFKPVKKGDLIAKGDEKYFANFNFIPIFAGEKGYDNILCLAAKKINSLAGASR